MDTEIILAKAQEFPLPMANRQDREIEKEKGGMLWM